MRDISKSTLRKVLASQRQSVSDRDVLSRRISEVCLDLPELLQPKSVLCYVGYRAEVQTAWLIDRLLERQVTLAVPYCQGDRLELCRIQSRDELAPDTWGIPEPLPDLRTQSARKIAANELDAVIVPGLGFDRKGNRLGYGKGYFDRLLANCRPTTFLVALAFECQLVAEIPTEDHDIPLQAIVTEREVIRVAE